MSRRKVVTEITIETNHVLVIKRRQLTRTWCSECGSEAEFVRLEEVNAVLDAAGIQRGVQPSSGSPLLTNAVGGSPVMVRRSLLGATTLAKRLLNCLRRGSKRESDTPR